ncbi:response regulator [Algoriphagus sp. NF]|jgi:CheY-like chemotaxis protein|uniref:Response regulator n=2 Tax=Algoriphagus TaxID=246875 RepID=A0ABS7N8H7_9BACT|nr:MULTISPECIES: response regulator [Algoriphagus]MBY5952631.1 response regulator [Algoriphagus marincola]MCR9082670.1 response regulator [Cyclobacteriaceae bacterium]MDE0559051.1 response regulator [Algoriphagus sp. NF]TDK48893.1 response regulator [Algoriphagus aquimaris]
MIQFDAIFLVDDDPINNLINKRLLGKTEVSESILEFLEADLALKKIEEFPQNQQLLIFLDINMPVMNGWEFLNTYQEKFPERKDEIVILSSSIDFQDRQKALSFNIVSGFLEKPLSLDKINYQLSKYI